MTEERTDMDSTENQASEESEMKTEIPDDQQNGEDNESGGGMGPAGDGSSSGGLGKGNEDKKVFVGGISYDTTNEDLLSYFGQFGDVSQAQVKYDQATGRSRGFAFVEFGSVQACKGALVSKDQEIKGKKVEVSLPRAGRTRRSSWVGSRLTTLRTS